MKILVLHGPNLNLLGSRETDLYGTATLEEINALLRGRAAGLKVEIVGTVQTNSEAELIDQIHEARGKVDGIVINPAAFTHTSIALRDALLGTGIPFVEVHLSNVYGREDYRQRSFLSDIAAGVVAGFGPDSYLLGLEGLVRTLGRGKSAADGY